MVQLKKNSIKNSVDSSTCTLLPSGCQIDIKLYTLLSLQCLPWLLFPFSCLLLSVGVADGGGPSRVYLQLATIVAEMHFTLPHFGGCTSSQSQSQSQNTSHVVPHSPDISFCFLAQTVIIQGWCRIQGLYAWWLHPSDIKWLPHLRVFRLFRSRCHKVAQVPH